MWLKNNVKSVLAVALLAVIFILFFLPSDIEVVDKMISALIPILVMVYSYYFGSSQGSSDKNDMLKGGKYGSR